MHSTIVLPVLSTTHVKYGIVSKLQEESCFDVEICPDLIIAAIGLAGAAALLAIYMALTMQPRRRRRDTSDEPLPLTVQLSELFVTGKYCTYMLGR